MIKRIQKQLAESTCRTSCIVSFEVEHIQRMYEENKGKIGRFYGAIRRRVRGQVEGSVCFCEDNGRISNGSNGDIFVRSGERVLGSFVPAEKGRTVAGGLRSLTQSSYLYHHISA